MRSFAKAQDKKIKIVFGLNDFLVGGMQRQFAEQLKHFDRNRFEITLVTLFEFAGKDTMYKDLLNDLEVYRLNFKGWFDVGAWGKLFMLLRRLKPDIVVSSIFFSNTAFRLLKPFVGYISIAREHNTYIHKPKLHQYFDRILAPLSYTIVGVSTGVADFTSAQEHIARKKFTVIHNGIDTLRMAKLTAELPPKEDIKRELGVVDKKVALNVARLTPQKNHRLLIDGFLEFRKRAPEYVLLLVGDGASRLELEDYVRKHGAEKAVLFQGNRSDVWRFYKTADFFVSAADIEGLSNAELEAAASGLPIVSTKTAGTDEIVEEGKNGFFIEGNTPQAVAEAMQKAARGDADSLRRNALEMVKRFDIRETVRKYTELFEEVS